MADYIKIVLIKSNWPYFESVFRRRADFERHMQAFSEFRNALMHNRPLTEIDRRAGELAIVWLETFMPNGNRQETGEENPDGNE